MSDTDTERLASGFMIPAPKCPLFNILRGEMRGKVERGYSVRCSEKGKEEVRRVTLGVEIGGEFAIQ